MKINRFWKKITQIHNHSGKEYALIAWGGSRQSEAHALEVAQRRLRNTIESFSPVKDRWSYDYLSSEIREPIYKEDTSGGEPDWVITRNRYGALVLNAGNVVFIDVDSRPGGCLFFGVGRNKEKLLSDIVNTVETKRIPCLIYETHSGYRILITDKLLTPGSPESESLMKQFKSDKLYAALCVRHQCYRARLTPKPFRINMETPKLTVENFDTPEIQDWIKEYDEKSQIFSTCKKVYDNPGAILPQVSQVMKIHDFFTMKYGMELA